ncbi:MAG: alpha/beta hydrolase [Candidatus Omnitrophica bacterium]|nr:alpha/beta hydrolase [Candidatus Omnitrophota bacterium]
MLGRIFLAVLIFSSFIFAYLRYFESKGIYYPTKDISLSPADIGIKYEDIFFTTEDGARLNGWFIPQEKPRGTLLFCHGNAGNIGDRVEFVGIFYKLNLNVLIFDYRGYGRSQGRPSEEGLYKDAQAAYRYLLSRKDINKSPIIIYGKSIGANVAIDLASKVNTVALIVDSAFTSACDMGRKLFPYLPVKWVITVKFDALAKIKEINIPKLIIHSRDDEIVPFKMGQRLFEAAPQPKEFYPMRGGHNEAIFIAGQEYASRIDKFLSKYLFRP